MLKRFRLYILAPIALAIASIVLLIRINVGDVIFFLPSDSDVLILLLGLGFGTTLSLTYIIQELLRRLREISVQRARNEAFSEHRRFLQRLDHELKNPLTALRAGLASLTLINQPDQRNTLIATLDSQALRLSQLVTSLRKLAEIDSLPVEMYAIDLKQFMGAIAELKLAHFSSLDRDFTLHFPDLGNRYPTLYGDQDLLLLAVHNVLDNAFKYSNTDDRIVLQLTIENNEYLVIQVSNMGTGIAEADLPYVWEELYRGSEVSHIPGNGIGLALVRKIINQHDGETAIASIPNEITTVTLSLPLDS